MSDPVISFNALFCPRTSRALRICGFVKTQPVQVLIDSMSTHNFITVRMAKFLTLTVDPIVRFRVQVGNGAAVICQGVCRSVPLMLQFYLFQVDLILLELWGAHIVLGVQWMETLGPMMTNYATLTMEFAWQQQQVRLKGETTNGAESIAPAQLRSPLMD